MDTERAAVALRNIIVDDDLASVNTTIYPDGALAYVVSAQAAYRLNKTSTAPPSGTSIIAPNAGPGRWLVQGALVDNRAAQVVGSVALAATTPTTVVVQNTWIALPTGSFFYISFTDGDFTLDNTTGILTYTGVTGQRYRISVAATLLSATAADVLDLAVSVAGDLIGSTDFTAAGVGAVDTTTPALGVHLTADLLILLTNGQTVQAIMRNETGAHNMTATHYNMILEPG